MKVLFIHNKYKQFGGEDVAVGLESSILKEKGHETETLIFDNDSIDGVFSKFRFAFQSVYSFSSARRVSRVIREFKPDIVHVHNTFFVASPSVIYAARRYRIPVVLTLHNYRMICCNALLLRDNKICELCTQKKFPLSGIRYKCYRNSAVESALVTFITGFHKIINTWKNKISIYITLNDFFRSKLLHSSLDVPAEKMITKSNCIPDPGEGKEQREDFFLFAGRISKEKGVHVLANAFADMPQTKILIAGDGPEKKILQEKYKTCSNIIFLGRLEKLQLTDYMNRSKAFICPTIWYEGTPLAIIEAFASGTPVIASNLGPLAESISDGYNGLHFTSGNAEDLKEKVKLFIKETEHNTLFYQNARQTFIEKYHINIHYNKIIKIYEKAIATQS